MKRHPGKKVVNPQWQPFELVRRNLGHRASFVVHECYRDVYANNLTDGSEEARLRASLRPPLKLHVRFSRMQLSRRHMT